jgi:hypothetical protein
MKELDVGRRHQLTDFRLHLLAILEFIISEPPRRKRHANSPAYIFIGTETL